MAEFTIKTFDEKIHNIYIKGDVDEDMWSNLVDKINEIKSEDDDIADQNLASLMFETLSSIKITFSSRKFIDLIIF